MPLILAFPHHRAPVRRLARDRSGVALVEFAMGLPVLLLAACYGIETANYALANLRVSQLALELADNASRVGVSQLTTQQLREVDIADVLQASRLDGARLNATKYGRVTLSSLEADSSGVQRIHWQRCLGLKSGATYTSHYNPAAGAPSTTAGTQPGTAYQGVDAPGGMGPSDAKVIAPPSSGVMFVEINYQYQPLFGSWLLGNRVIHYPASFIVRDRRDFTQIFNPDPQVATADKLTCDRFTS